MFSKKALAVLILLGALIVGPLSGALYATNILVYGDDGRKNTVAADLSAQGHTVTNVAAIPADISGFDEVWAFHIFSAFSGAESASLAAFVSAGGGLYLTGERPCCEAANTSIEALLNSLVIGGGISVGGMGDVPGGETYSFNPGAAGGISTTPNVLGPWAPSAPGRLAGVSGDNILTLGNLGDIGGGVWDSPDLVPGVGRIALLMDIDWISGGPPGDRVNIVENIELYLRPGAQAPEPTTLVLLGVGLLGLDVLRRRRR
jgi:hypothetical protein